MSDAPALKCPNCEERFSSGRDVKQHVRDVHAAAHVSKPDRINVCHPSQRPMVDVLYEEIDRLRSALNAAGGRPAEPSDSSQIGQPAGRPIPAAGEAASAPLSATSVRQWIESLSADEILGLTYRQPSDDGTRGYLIERTRAALLRLAHD